MTSVLGSVRSWWFILDQGQVLEQVWIVLLGDRDESFVEVSVEVCDDDRLQWLIADSVPADDVSRQIVQDFHAQYPARLLVGGQPWGRGIPRESTRVRAVETEDRLVDDPGAVLVTRPLDRPPLSLGQPGREFDRRVTRGLVDVRIEVSKVIENTLAESAVTRADLVDLEGMKMMMGRRRILG